MNEEITTDLFRFLSKDKISITSEDLETFESFLSKSEFADLNEHLLQFVNDLVFWSVQALEMNINIQDEGQFNIKANNQLKKKDSGIKPNSNAGKSYKQLYKKHLEFNRLKNSEIKKSLRHVVKNKKITLKISLDLLKAYFKRNVTHRELIIKFMTRLETIIINHELKLRQSTLSKIRKSRSRTWKFYIGDMPKSVDNSVNKSCIDEHSKSKANSTIIQETAQNKSCLSDNEVILKTKVNFLNVLKDVTKSMVDQINKEGGDLTIIRDSVPKEDKIQTVIENNITFNKQEEVREQDLSVRVKDKVEEVTNSHTEKVGKSMSSVRKKEACKCHCLVF